MLQPPASSRLLSRQLAGWNGTGPLIAPRPWWRRGDRLLYAAVVVLLLCALLAFNMYMWTHHSVNMHSAELKELQHSHRPEQLVAVGCPQQTGPVAQQAPAALTDAQQHHHPFSVCRPGTQRCIAWSTATDVSRFPLLTTAADSAAAGIALNPDLYDLSYSMLSRATLQPGAQARSPYDADGTPLFRQELQEYIVRHIRSTDFAAAERRIIADVDALAAAGSLPTPSGASRDAAIQLERFRRWRSWLEEQKYLIYVDGEEGMGNKLQPMVSSFALALIQKRTFLMYFTVPHFEELFNLGPRPGQGLGRQEGLPLLTSWKQFFARLVETHRKFDPTYVQREGAVPDMSASRPLGEHMSAASLLGLSASTSTEPHWSETMLTQLLPGAPEGVKPMSRTFWPKHAMLLPQGKSFKGGADAQNGEERDVNFKQIEIYMGPADSTQQEADLLCTDLLQGEYYTSPWLTISTGYQYWVSTLVGNPFTRKRVLALLNEGNMYGPLARFVLNWHEDRIRSPAAAFAQRHFSTYNIGIQLRMKERLALVAPEVRSAIEAARALAVLYQPQESEYEVIPAAERSEQLKGLPENTAPAGTFGMFLSPAAEDESRKARPYVTFFLATDNFPLRAAVAKELAPYGHVAYSPSTAYPRNEAKGAYYMGESEQFSEGLEWSILDHLLLAACDDMITSPSSTFGYVAHGFGSLIPHRIRSTDSEEKEKRPQVLRALSAEPGSHFWKPLFREVSRWGLCRIEADLPAQAQTEECCPRWNSPHEATMTVQRLIGEFNGPH